MRGDEEERMTNTEAKAVLRSIAGIIGLCALTDNNEHLSTIFLKYGEAVDIACDAIDIMDHQMTIEDKNDGK